MTQMHGKCREVIILDLAEVCKDLCDIFHLFEESLEDHKCEESLEDSIFLYCNETCSKPAKFLNFFSTYIQFPTTLR